MPMLTEVLVAIHAACSRKKAAFDLVREGPEFILVAGSHQAIRSPEGTIVSMSVSREKLQALRVRINELLAEPDA